MSNATSMRAVHEVAHGKELAQSDPERIWGWGTPAGKRRARGRAKLIAAGANLGPEVKALAKLRLKPTRDRRSPPRVEGNTDIADCGLRNLANTH